MTIVYFSKKIFLKAIILLNEYFFLLKISQSNLNLIDDDLRPIKNKPVVKPENQNLSNELSFSSIHDDDDDDTNASRELSEILTKEENTMIEKDFFNSAEISDEVLVLFSRQSCYNIHFFSF